MTEIEKYFNNQLSDLGKIRSHRGQETKVKVYNGIASY